MDSGKIIETVLMEINRSVSGISHKSLEALVEAVNREKRIFCDGVGRSRLKAEGFAMRLIQMGFTALVVGEATTPAITRDDMLLICSASGETPMLVEHAAKAKKVGAAVMLITTSETSSLAVLSDFVITIDASSKTTRSDASVQPMGSLFEQSIAILLDIIVLCLMEKHGISSDDMYRNHSNLE
ncbi:MAG: 6-phospho-3-hexuloisomerase [Enterocloster sp.]|nr:6-phospho-3-hexuloisomerase [Enterocloster bolteae]MCG4899485.1 SIS domain-containing protein [Enterocloster bolteae]RGB98695.1 SIS domain-containing protein [Hungatella hathewayi]UOX72494.1 SIS domain-containing protein [Enterocloster bolteae]